MDIPTFQNTILDWHSGNRRDMPWRSTHDPYRILVSEVMLHQTQVTRVIPKYHLFLDHFPDVNALSLAPQNKLLEIWQGLGYWRRALFLRSAAKIIVSELNGSFPSESATLQRLPGVGPYTASAIACFAFGSTEAFLDTNIRRVYLHFFFQDVTDVHDREIMKIAAEAVRTDNPREWHYALFDYGACVLTRDNTNHRSKHYKKQSAFEGSFRSFRTKAVRRLLTEPHNSMSKRDLREFVSMDIKAHRAEYQTDDVIEALLNDNLIKECDGRYKL